MEQAKPKPYKKRFRNSWITSLISISLVLVVLGMLCILLINARQLSQYVREKIGFTLVLKDNLKEAEMIRVRKLLSASDPIKSIRYIDKEAAARELSEQLGEDFSSFLGYNPLFASFDVKLYAPYTHADSIRALETAFLAYPQILEVRYQKNILTLIDRNIQKISIVLLVLSALLILISFALINNTIRILIYSQRFTINTMQMVGAGRNFIRKPFLLRSIYLGAYGALIANIILAGIYYWKPEELQIPVAHNPHTDILVSAVLVFVFGLLISFLSTLLAINKFLRLRFDELFY